MINMQPKLISIETLKCKRNNTFLFGLLSESFCLVCCLRKKILLFGLLSEKKSFRLVCCFCEKHYVWFTVCAKIGVWLTVCAKIGVWLVVCGKIGTCDVDAGYERK